MGKRKEQRAKAEHGPLERLLTQSPCSRAPTFPFKLISNKQMNKKCVSCSVVTNVKQKNQTKGKGAILAKVVKVGLSENGAFELRSE